MKNHYHFFHILKEIHNSNRLLKFNVIGYLFISILIRLSPLITASIISILINKSFISTRHNVMDSLILLIPLSISTIYIINKLTEWLLQLINKLYFVNIMITAGESFCSRAFEGLIRMPLSESSKKEPEQWSSLLNKRQDIILGFSLLYSHLIPLMIELLLISLFILISGQTLITFVFILSLMSNIFIRLKFSRKIESGLKSYFHVESKMVLKSYEFVSKIYLVKLFHSENFLINLRKKYENEELFIYRTHKKIFQYVDSFQESISVIGTVIIFFIGYHAYNNNDMSIGLFIALFTLVLSGLGQFKNIVYAFEGIFSLIEISQIHMTILDYIKNNKTVITKKHIIHTGQLEIKNIHFAYQKDVNILNNINMNVQPNEKIFLLGYSGSGKTTFIKLMLNLVGQYQGIITYNGQSNTDIFSYVPQSLELFNDSVANNLLLGNQYATEEEMLNVLQRVNMLSKINLMGGIHTHINNFSGGEKQRLAIARALISQKPIMLLDEPTSSLDVKNEKTILNEIINNKDLTAIISIHRIHSIPLKSRCIFMHEGTIVQDGVLDDLITQPGFIHDLWHTKDS